VITGFNTDIEHDGVVYHVQTEDKGLESPIILSLVYTGGAILASKRSPYVDLIASGYSDEALADRLKRQHRLICAAIHSGRIDDLKKMSGKPEAGQNDPLIATDPLVLIEEATTSEPPIETEIETEAADTSDTTDEAPEILVEASDNDIEPESEFDVEAEHVPITTTIDADIILGIDEQQEMIWELLSKKKEPEVQASAQEPETESEALPTSAGGPPTPPTVPYTVYDQRRATESLPVESSDGIVIKLLDEDEFYSGELRMLRVFVTERHGDKEKALINYPVSIKILGTAFRPMIYSLKTERDGVATVSTEIPEFTSGRAAVLIRVVGKDNTAELRRVIYPSAEVRP